MNSAAQAVRKDGWFYAVVFLLLGYLCMNRSFAYWGIPPLYLFVGELFLGSFLLFGPQLSRGKWPWIARDVPQLQGFKRALYLLMACGAFAILHGILAGYPPLIAFRDFAFDYYPLYFFLGLWVGLCRPDALPRFIRIFAWVNGIYGTAFVLYLNRIPWTFPGFGDRAAPVPIFGLPQSSFLALLGLLAFEKNLRKAWPLLALNGFVMLAMQVRGEWLAFAVGLAIWAWRGRNFKRAACGGVFVLLVLGVMAVTSLQLPGVEGRSADTSISAEGLVGRALAPVNPSLAANYNSSLQQKFAVGTVTWRLMWWAQIWSAVGGSVPRTLFGFGYGYPLRDLSPLWIGNFIQTPHSGFFYALGYTGWVGVILFFWLLAEVGRLLLRVPDASLGNFGVAVFYALVSYSMFEPYFEAPMGAIPFYLIVGIVAAAVLRRQRRPSHPAARPEGSNLGLAPVRSG